MRSLGRNATRRAPEAADSGARVASLATSLVSGWWLGPVGPRRCAGAARRAELPSVPLSDFHERLGSASGVWRLVVERAWGGSRPGHRTDGARVALAVEGGGMTGAVSAGMCVALEAWGLTASFDVIYGSSSGALNASFTAAGQARARAGLYPRVAEAGLIDPRRALRGRPVFRLGEIVNSLLVAHPHDEKLLSGRPPLRVTATRVQDKGLDILGDFSSMQEVRRAVWASCAIPILAGDIVEFRGDHYVDGGLIESMPYAAALREGATHVLVLRARHADYRLRPYPPAALRTAERMFRAAPDTLVELIRERPARYNAEAGALQSANETQLAERVVQLAPPSDVRCTSQFEARAHRLVDAVRLGARTAYQTVAPYLAPGDACALSWRDQAMSEEA
ncbi:MAG: patatin-like phospholipase family protein [Solirubrobacteraceae bacterium]